MRRDPSKVATAYVWRREGDRLWCFEALNSSGGHVISGPASIWMRGEAPSLADLRAHFGPQTELVEGRR